MFDSLMVLIIGNSTTLARSTYAVISRGSMTKRRQHGNSSLLIATSNSCFWLGFVRLRALYIETNRDHSIFTDR